MVPRAVFFRKFCLLLVLTIGSSGLASSLVCRQLDTRPFLMAGLGDSITAGFAANWPGPKRSGRSNNLSLGTGSQVLDSDTFYPEAPVFGENRETLSWSVGNQVNSHAQRLSGWLKLKDASYQLKSINLSISGGMVSQIPEQVEKLEAELNKGVYRGLLYVTLLIGGNDLCQGKVDSASIESNLHKALERLDQVGLKQGFRVRVLFSAVPRIADLGLPQIQNARSPFGLTCRSLRENFLKYCFPLILWKDQKGYEDAQAYVNSFNIILKGVATYAAANLQNLQIHFTETLGQLPVDLKLLGGDCFHPSRAGQEEIARVLWPDELFLTSWPSF